MSDFITHLFDRSFKSDASLESVRPRLPTLFEKSLVNQTEFNTPFLNQAKQTDDETGLSPIGKSIHRNPIIPRERDIAAADVQANGNLSPIAPIVPQFKRVNSHSNTPYGTDQLPSSQQSTERAPSQNDAIERAFVSRSVQSLLQESTENSSNTVQRVENKQRNATMPDVPVLPLFGTKPDFKTARSEAGLNNLLKNNEFQPLAGNQGNSTKLSASFVADSALLEQLITEKIALQGNRESLVKNDSANNLAPADVSNLNIQWPQAVANRQPLENNNRMVLNPPEPTIQVTIGRIEIRANQSTPSGVPRNQDKKPTTMSLEEYLNKRDGGAR
jgi:hypothetical protein